MTDAVVSPSESVRPLPAPPMPSACDICHGGIGPDTEFVTIQIVSDSTPRRLREKSGSGFLEEEWNVVVCSACNERFRTWLFGSDLVLDDGDPSELDTLPPPAGEDIDEMAPVGGPPPNRS